MLRNKERFFSEEELKSDQVQSQTAKVQEKLWLNLLMNIDLLQQVITEKDEQVLKYLEKVDVIKYPDNENYTVEFYFSENEFIENEKLSVTVHIDDDSNLDLNIEEIRGDIIEWKPNKNYLVQIQNNEEKRINPSFFWFFKSFKAVDFEVEDDEECVEYEMDDLSDRTLFNMSKDIGNLFRDYFFVYLIPAVYGIVIPEFYSTDDYQDVEHEEKAEKGNLCKSQ